MPFGGLLSRVEIDIHFSVSREEWSVVSGRVLVSGTIVRVLREDRSIELEPSEL